MGPDGALIRRQDEPRRETVEIRGDFIHVRKSAPGGADETQVMPIPEALSPLLTTLRTIVARGAPEFDDAALTADAAGWRLDIPSGAAALRLFGCGETLLAVELDPTEGLRRKIVFEPQ